MKKTYKGLFIAIALVALCEAFAALFFFRYYAIVHRAFLPSGSSSISLLQRIYLRVTDRVKPQITADHGPIFVPDKTLGYVMSPGTFQITERMKNQVHVFRLTVTEKHTRQTALEHKSAKHRVFVTGDSFMHGWGLNDEETISWLLQQRLRDCEVIDMAVNSYSTVQTLLQLQQIATEVRADDLLVLAYHPGVNDLNVMNEKNLKNLRAGFEVQLSNASDLASAEMPFGVINDEGQLVIRKIKLSCLPSSAAGECFHPPKTQQEKENVTNKTFDKIVELWPGKILVSITGVNDGDTVVTHLKTASVTIVEIPDPKLEADGDDMISTDLHPGAFLTYNRFQRIYSALSNLIGDSR